MDYLSIIRRWTVNAVFVTAAMTMTLSVVAKQCAGDNGGLSLSPGFCATVFAENIGHARHLVVAPNGVVYVNTWSGPYYAGLEQQQGGLLVALQDTQRTGQADVIKRFGDSFALGNSGGTGIALYKGALYVDVKDRILRYTLRAGEIVPTAAPEVIVYGLPFDGDHPQHPFIIDAQGNLFISSGTATNSCQYKNRVLQSPGHQPCRELETRGGIWRYDANKTKQKFSPAERYATGIRNGEGLVIDDAGRMLVSQHGRDQLYENWPEFYRPIDGHEQPAEEVVQIKQGADYGWPECYYDVKQKKLVLAPEYGGDGGKKVGICAQKQPSIAQFPAHWAPDAMLIYSAKQFPASYRGGLFIAFHGSWNRAPGPQGGYNVVYQPMANGMPSGNFVVFADGFAGPIKEPEGSRFRPSGLAVGPDGALYISEDKHGRIWRVVYEGDAAAAAANVASAPLEEKIDDKTGMQKAALLPLPPGGYSGTSTQGLPNFSRYG
jgi:glucose/arabinose dehydrogenase